MVAFHAGDFVRVSQILQLDLHEPPVSQVKQDIMSTPVHMHQTRPLRLQIGKQMLILRGVCEVRNRKSINFVITDLHA